MAKAIVTSITGRLSYIERKPSSANGNPRYLVAIDLGNETANGYLTAVDGSVGYEVTNYRIGREVTLTLKGKRQYIVAMAYADGTEG